MNSAYVARVVRDVLTERGFDDALERVGVLPFAWDVVLRSPSGVERHLIVPTGPSEGLADVIRWALPSSWNDREDVTPARGRSSLEV
jgi:hypothetical protein